MANIEKLRKETDEIKSGLEDLKKNLSKFSEADKQKKVEMLKAKIDATKQKIQAEINSLSDKTDEESKKKKEEAEALLNSFEKATKLYFTIITPNENTETQQTIEGTQTIEQQQKEGKSIFQKTKEWIGDQQSDIGSWFKKQNETTQQINKITDFIMNFDSGKFTNWNSIYNDENTKNIVLMLLNYAGFNEIGNESSFEESINKFASTKGVSGSQEICKLLADNYYRVCLNEWIPIVYDESSNRRKNGKIDKSASIKESVFACIEGLVSIGTVDENDLMNYQFIKDDLNNLGFKDLNDLKEYSDTDTIKALEYVKAYGEQAKLSNQSGGIKTETLDGDIYAPGAYSKMLTKEYNYFNLAKNSWGVLSLEDYNELFGNFYKFGQTNVGDCYLISVIRGLARTQYFDTLMRTSVKKNDDGSFVVKMPLGEPEGTEVHISKSELEKASVKGSDGYKLIEIAFAHFCEERNIESEKDLKNISGWFATGAMDILMGRQGYKTNTYIVSINKNKIIQKLKDFNPGRGDVISFNRLSRIGGKNDVLPTNHCMTILEVEKDQNGNVTGVQVENPWNSPDGGEYESQKYMTIDEFLNFAHFVECGSITDDFMNLDSSSYLPAQQSWDRARYNYLRLGNDGEHIGEARNRWHFDPSWEGVKNIPKAASDFFSPVWDGCVHIGKGVGYTAKSGYQYTVGGVKNVAEWTGKKATNAREGTKKATKRVGEKVTDGAKWVGEKAKSGRNKIKGWFS